MRKLKCKNSFGVPELDGVTAMNRLDNGLGDHAGTKLNQQKKVCRAAG